MTEEERESRRRARKKWAAANPEKEKASKDKWKRANPDKVREIAKKARDANPAKVRDKQLRKRYKISLADFEAMCTAQGHVCAICGEAGELVVDHCHKTGAVRGLPCRLCNVGLGCFRDNPEFLAAAIKYLGGRKL